ncbi:hypothetical protein, partial [Streptomyces sp. NPDC005568]|uniref:hypothetical protein n=1 Tax=Streptomyces sp. NPDC005568 TaxID=3156887 RepID=UPI0033B702A7
PATQVPAPRRPSAPGRSPHRPAGHTHVGHQRHMSHQRYVRHLRHQSHPRHRVTASPRHRVAYGKYGKYDKEAAHVRVPL